MISRSHFAPLQRLPVLGAALAILLVTGCWEEDSNHPSPTPTPTPTPTPAPSPSPTPAPLSSSAQDTSGNVALANAEIVEAAALDSANELLALERTLSNGDLTKKTLAGARMSLTNAREAFHLVEASLFYSDPENPEELSTLPPHLITVLPSLDIPDFAKLEALLSHQSGGKAAPELLEKAASLRAELDTLAAAWSAAELGNFRNTFFLPDPNAPARIFQGLAAISDILVFSSLSPEKEDQILPRLWTVKDLLEGTYESFQGHTTSGAGVIVLLAEKDAAAAGQLLELVDGLIRRHETPVNGVKTTGSLQTLRNEILAAARLLGYELEPAESDGLGNHSE